MPHFLTDPEKTPASPPRLCRNCAVTPVHRNALIRKRPLIEGPFFQYFVFYCVLLYLSVPLLFGTQKPLGLLPCGFESRPRHFLRFLIRYSLSIRIGLCSARVDLWVGGVGGVV